MENIGYITLENMGELAEFFYVETEGRSAIAIEADIKKGISTVITGFKKILNILAGWCKKAFYAITKKDTCAVNPDVYTIGQTVISKGKAVVKLGEKVARSGSEDQKLKQLEDSLNEAKDKYNETVKKVNERQRAGKGKSNITKIPVNTNKIKVLIKGLSDDIRIAETILSGDKGDVMNNALRAIINGLTSQKNILNSFIFRGGVNEGNRIEGESPYPINKWKKNSKSDTAEDEKKK